MLSDGILEDRLNAVKRGEAIPKVENQDRIITSLIAQNNEKEKKGKDSSFLRAIKIYLINLAKISLEVILFGYAMRGLFETNWIFIETIGIGFLITSILLLPQALIKRKLEILKKENDNF